jgi:hypothetical protein
LKALAQTLGLFCTVPLSRQRKYAGKGFVRFGLRQALHSYFYLALSGNTWKDLGEEERVDGRKGWWFGFSGKIIFLALAAIHGRIWKQWGKVNFASLFAFQMFGR